MSRFVMVSRKSMTEALEKAGFTPFQTGGRSAELGYFRCHGLDPNIQIKIYTSLPADRSVARGCGEDAIRVVAVFDDGAKNFPICKLPRVHRTGSEAAVIERTLERAREAWRFVNLWLRTPYAERKFLPRPGEKEEAREARQRQGERT